MLAPDNRGVGGSRGGAPFTLEGAADDAALVLADAGFRAARGRRRLDGRPDRVRDGRAPPGRGRAPGGGVVRRAAQPSHRRVMRFFEIAFTRLGPAEASEVFMAFAFGSAFADKFPGFVDQAAKLWTLDPEDRPSPWRSSST